MPSACWERDFDAPVTAIWETLGDTARYNEAAGLPRQKITEQPRPDGSTRYLAETRMGWITATGLPANGFVMNDNSSPGR